MRNLVLGLVGGGGAWLIAKYQGPEIALLMIGFWVGSSVADREQQCRDLQNQIFNLREKIRTKQTDDYFDGLL